MWSGPNVVFLKVTVATKMAYIMVALAQADDVILKKSGRLFQTLMDIISQSWVIEKAFCTST